MKISISLKWLVSLVFLTMGIALVVGYTKLSGRYFILGMDNMVASNMERSAQQSDLQKKQAQDNNGFFVSRDWQQQPIEIQNSFAQAPMVSGELMKKIERKEGGGRPTNILFAMRYGHQENAVYVSHSLPRDEITKMIRRNIKKSRKTLSIISGLSVLALALVLGLLLWIVSRPITALGDWTRSLEADKLDKPVPDFSYPELNAMAELIRNSLYSVHEGLERKQQFLQYTSHELRTPISVIRNNLELLYRLQTSSKQEPDDKQQATIDRIDRASLTMKHLTETLLWLSKESSEPLPKKEMALDVLLKDVVAEMQYLLDVKPVKVEVDTEAFNIALPEVVAKIVLGNLIRNAFQHTWEGDVVIRQRGNQVDIINTEKSEETKEGNLGFGLGLQLTQQLVDQLGWTYENTSQLNEHKVVIVFN